VNSRGPVVDDDLHVAFVVLDAKIVVLDRVARLGNTVAAAEVEEVGVNEGDDILGEVGGVDASAG